MQEHMESELSGIFRVKQYFLRHYGGQLKTVVEKEAGEKIDWKRQ